ncbi:hypothetical protein NPIL_259671 [Nephila pilipes]|uniref:Uncharacterized protein n=1 Tax=Nephila pilipes TaxID=299642 RepID=A0A8X6QNB0_NEPPI|nr:hypothetical protein NPIL_259671 [Nephila pilipes]
MMHCHTSIDEQQTNSNRTLLSPHRNSYYLELQSPYKSILPPSRRNLRISSIETRDAGETSCKGWSADPATGGGVPTTNGAGKSESANFRQHNDRKRIFVRILIMTELLPTCK